VNGPPGTHLGVKLGDAAEDAGAATALDRRLKALRGQLEVYFAVCVGMIVVLFLAQLGVVLTQFDKPALVKAAVAVCGVSTFGLITFLARLWRDRDRTATIIALAEALEP